MIPTFIVHETLCFTKLYLCECYWVIYVVLYTSLTAYYPMLHEKVTNHILLDDMSPTAYYPMLHDKATNHLLLNFIQCLIH